MKLAIRAGLLFNGIGRNLQKDVTIFIEEGRIIKLRPLTAKIPRDYEVMDAQDRFVMPGLIDAHVHTCASSRDGLNTKFDNYTGMLALRSYIHAKQNLEHGYTTLRDCGSRGYVDIALREAINSGLLIGPRMKVSGYPLSITGGHGDQEMFYDPIYRNNPGVCDSPDEARKAARCQLKMGVDFIKIMATGGTFINGGEPGAQQFTEEEMRAIVEVAHQANRRVAAHAMGTSGIKAALAAGVDSIEHGYFLDDEAIDLMLEKEAFYVPTLVTLHVISSRAEELLESDEPFWLWEAPRWRSGESREEILKQTKCDYGRFIENFKAAYEAGVKIVAGSDVGATDLHHGITNSAELELMVRYGVDPIDALVSSTGRAAELLGIQDITGMIEPGKYADLLVVQGNPVESISVLRDVHNIVKVFKEGELVVNREM